MKKSKKIGLSLNKKVVSNLQSSSIKGGLTLNCGWTTLDRTNFIDCGSNTHCGSRATCNQN